MGDTVKVTITAMKVGTTEINLFSSSEVKNVVDKSGKILTHGVKQKTKEENVYLVDLQSESGCNGTYYFTRIAHRGNSEKPDEDPEEVTFDPKTNNQVFLGKIRDRWGKEGNVLEITPLSGNREDGYDSYKGLDENRKLQNRKYVQLHVKGASDGCLLCVGSNQFISTEENITIDNTNLKENSSDTQEAFMELIKEFQKDDKKSGFNDDIKIVIEQIKKDK
jgi:hypothetical protein